MTGILQHTNDSYSSPHVVRLGFKHWEILRRRRARERKMRLAAQVQARTQQLAATEGQSKNVLVSTHVSNLAAARKSMQAAECELSYKHVGSDDMDRPNQAALLTTARLRLRPFTLADVDLLHALDSDSEVMRFISRGQSTPREVIAQKVLPRWIESYAHPRPYGYWAVETVAGQFVGWVHLRTDRISPPDLEVGYRFIRPVWGQGFATESARAVIETAFAAEICEHVSARTLEANLASQRVMVKCGLEFREHFVYSSELLPAWTEQERRAVKFGGAREQWLRANRR